MSSTTRSELSRDSACPSVSRFNTISPIRFSSLVSSSVPDPLRTDQSERRVRCESFGLVEVLVARQAAADRLPQQIGQRELLVQALSRVAQVFFDELLQTQSLIQLTN